MKTKYEVIGSEAQVAAVDFGASLSKARRAKKATTFSNGCRALVLMDCRTKREAEMWRERCAAALAYISGRLGRWLTPTFVVRAGASRQGYGPVTRTKKGE